MRARILQFTLLFLLMSTVSCLASQKPVTNTPAPSAGSPVSLVGTEWLLVDLAGAPVIANSKASLSFLEEGRIAGNGSCNRFMGGVTIAGDSLKFGPLASSQMACGEDGVSAQENQYLKLLGAAKRFELKDGVLLIYSEGSKKPLRFSRQTTAKP